MRQIKIILISLYTIILGFIVFGNTSVFGADTITENKQQFVYTYTSGLDDYWRQTQDNFDYQFTHYNKTGNNYFLTRIGQLQNYLNNFNYIAIPVSNVRDAMGLSYGSSDGDLRGYVVCIYSSITSQAIISSNTDFSYFTLNNYFGGFMADNSVAGYNENMSFSTIHIPVNMIIGIYDYGNNYEERSNTGQYNNIYCPLTIFNYYHHIYYEFLNQNSTNGATQITGAINTQTNTIVNETQKQTNQITGAVTNATQQQTNQLLDTNDTGNTTLEVNANVTDNSVNLDNFFMSIYNAFTSASGVVTKRLTLKLPNNSDFDVVVRSDMLSNFFENNTIFKVFYQAFWWVSLGGYVIFDVKRMYNLVMIGKWDVLHLIDKPTDVVVDLSTGGSGKGGSIY